MIHRPIKAFIAAFSLISAILAQTGVLIMSPEPNSAISGDNVLIAASLIGVNNLNANSVRVMLDGVDVTDQAYVDSDMVSCLLEDIDPGHHEIDLVIDGPVGSTKWNFSAIGKESILNYSGRIRSSNSMDQIDDQTLNINKMTIYLKGSAYEWLDLKTNLKMTSQESDLYQPRNVYGLTLGIKDILTLRMGDSNPRISNYTMNGKEFEGWTWILVMAGSIFDF